jgi:hypothetical protein
VRVSLGLSFHDESSLAEAVDSLRFAADDPDPIARTGSIREERRYDDIGRSDDIQVVDR